MKYPEFENNTGEHESVIGSIYIAGPMRGIPNFNYPAFYEAERKLVKYGWNAFNPARKDIEVLGVDVSLDNPEGCETKASTKGFSIRKALAIDLQWVSLHADALFLLPRWQDSTGARAEVCTAIALGLDIYDHNFRFIKPKPSFDRVFVPETY